MIENCKVCNGKRHVESNISAEPHNTGIKRQICNPCKGTGRLDGGSLKTYDLDSLASDAFAEVKEVEAKKLAPKKK